MADSYCAKNCNDCIHREKLDCPGCKEGPGREISGDCELARCCRSKFRSACSDCVSHTDCETLRSRYQIPALRVAILTAHENEQAAFLQRFPQIGKWLTILFWLVIPANLGELLTTETLAGAFPALRLPGQLLTVLASLAYGLILLKLTCENDRYKTAGILFLIGAALNAISTFVPDMGALSLVVTLPAGVLTLIGEYNEFHAHAQLVEGANIPLAQGWETLWKWTIGSFLATIAGLLLTPILGVFALLITLVASIAVIIVAILKLVYLYRTAAFTRSYAAQT